MSNYYNQDTLLELETEKAELRAVLMKIYHYSADLNEDTPRIENDLLWDEIGSVLEKTGGFLYEQEA